MNPGGGEYWAPQALAEATTGPVLCAHRGASAHERENTVAAARSAAQLGAAWVEFDVRPTADRVLVVHHDPVTADGVVIGDTTAAELDPAIPTFGDFVAACGSLGLDIEMKTDEIPIGAMEFVDLVADQVARHRGDRSADALIVTSFDHDVLAEFAVRHGEIATGVLFDDRPIVDVIELATARGHDAVVPWFRLVDAAGVEAAHRAGLGVATWTVNEPGDIAAMAGAGVDLIIGDDPLTLARHAR